MKKYIFATLAVGVAYNYKVRTLIDCVITLTKGDILLITDDYDDLDKYVTDAGYDRDRIFIKRLEEVTPQNPWFAERKFNFNLKRLPTAEAYKMGGYDLIVHCDADGFMIGWDEDSIQGFINHPDSGMIARFRNRPCEEGGVHFILHPKAEALSLELIKIKARMPIEVFMFFKPNCPEFQKFMDQWEMITTRCHDRGIDPFMEALEISYALSESNLPHHTVLNFMREFPVLHSFRYLHHDKILRII